VALASDTCDRYALRFPTACFLGQAGQVFRVASEQDDRPGLLERDHGQKRIEGAPVTRQSGPPEQFAGRPPLRLIDRDYRYPAEHAVHAGVRRPASQDFGKSRRGGNDVAMPPSSNLEDVPRPRVAAGQPDETFGIKNQ
jgi:hypothetical protein